MGPLLDPVAGAEPGPPRVEAQDLGWTYRGRSRQAITGITFSLAPGRVLLVLGPSGSGKSTLARALAGLVPHVLAGTWWGRLTVGDLDVAETPARILGERVGLVFQDPQSQLVMARVDDDVAFGLENRGWRRQAMLTRVPAALGEVGLAGFERRATATLSGGEQQRLAIADVLAPAPRLLVFDEPTANLDPPGMHATLERLAALAARREHTIVLIEHRLDAALPLADDVLLIDGAGRQLAFAPAAEVGPATANLLARTGAWIPRAWAGFEAEGSPASGETGAGHHFDMSSATGPRPSLVAAELVSEELVGETLVVRAEELGVTYPAETKTGRPALAGVSVVVRRGERLALVGPNGAGKSTLLLALAGLLRPATGRVSIRDRAGVPVDPARVPVEVLSSLVGVVFQDPELGFVARTVLGEVLASTFAARRPRRSADTEAGRRDAVAVLGRFGLADLAGEDPFRLSQGEQRRLSLAALALRPPAVLLLDEPTFGLDRRGTTAVLELLDQLRDAGQAQVLATHDPRLLPACDRVVALDRGRLVFEGHPAAFLGDPPYEPQAPWQEAGLAAFVEPGARPAMARAVPAAAITGPAASGGG